MKISSPSTAAFFLTAALIAIGPASPAAGAEPDRADPLPRVLLIGDSISGGYQKGVKKLLAGRAVVVKNEGNAQHTGTGLKKIDEWLGDGNWDVIHFNWGLWDMYGWEYAKEDRSPRVYEQNLEALVTRLEKTGAKLIWATTTPACPGPEGTMLNRFKTKLRITPAVERQYQDAALRVMKKHKVRVNDLYSLMLPDLDKYSPAPDNVHFTGAGCGVLARQVADSILAALAEGETCTTPDCRKPNIVFILADDMGFDSVSFNNAEMGPLKTPHIDRLRSQGMNFTDAHSGSAVCTPTRYGLLTGRYCWRTPLKQEVLWDYGRPLIEKERLTVADLLQEQGYTTGIVGKWHLGLDWYEAGGQPANRDLQITDAIWRNQGGSAERVRTCEKRIDWTRPVTGGPLDHGFDYYFGVDLPNMPPYAWIDGDRLTAIPTVPKPEEMFGTEGPMVPGWKLEEVLPTIARRSGEWIVEQLHADKPFFLYLSLTSPHTPIAPSKPFHGRSGVNRYGDFIVETDWVVGHVMEALDRAGLADNTILIFTADNGTAFAARFPQLEAKGVNLRHHFKGNKGQIHEGGHRVPFVVRWPGKVKPGSTCRELVCLNDFMATVADLHGVRLPDKAAEDSTSLLPLLTGQSDSLPQRPAVVHHDYKGNFAIRKGRWKLVQGGEPALFDLENDPKESNNLAAEHPEIVKQLAGTLAKYQQSGRSRELTLQD